MVLEKTLESPLDYMVAGFSEGGSRTFQSSQILGPVPFLPYSVRQSSHRPGPDFKEKEKIPQQELGRGAVTRICSRLSLRNENTLISMEITHSF